MAKSKVAPDYLKKGEIIELQNHELLNAFERAVTNVCIMQNCRAKVSQKASKEVEWIRDELLQRLR
jgi:hypothetical protein